MSRYALEYRDGRVTEIAATTDGEAESMACRRIGGDAIIADDWDWTGIDDDGNDHFRALIWESVEDSIDDDGAKAVAELTVVKPHPA